MRISAAGRVLAQYSLAGLDVAAGQGQVVGLRVSEADGRLVTAWQSGVVHASSFDGTPLWHIAARPAGGMLGGFDLTDDGMLYVLESGTPVRIFDAAGNATGSVTLAAPAGSAPVTDLRLHRGQLFVRRSDPATLFEVYDAASGALVRSGAADVEKLTVTVDGPVWTAGTPISRSRRRCSRVAPTGASGCSRGPR